MGHEDTHLETGSEPTSLQCALALALILVAFWVSDVTPGPVLVAAERDPALAWTAPIRHLDDALGRQSPLAARQAWHDAHWAALGSGRWDAMLAVGDVALRVGELTGQRAAAEATARQAYLTALFRARQQSALDGVLRAADAFAALGDHEVEAQCLRAARVIAAQAGDPAGEVPVRALAGRLAAR
jgi:hypothetical protein